MCTVQCSSYYRSELIPTAPLLLNPLLASQMELYHTKIQGVKETLFSGFFMADFNEKLGVQVHGQLLHGAVFAHVTSKETWQRNVHSR